MTEAEHKAAGSKGKYIGVGVGVGIVAIIGVIALASMSVNSNRSTETPTVAGSIEHRTNIVNGIIEVDAGGYQYYTFSTPDQSYSASVTGNFMASGGSGNDIAIYILDGNGFVNWKNGHSADTYYNSGQLTTGELDAGVPTGETLYLVFDNTFSAFSSKDINTKVDLVYFT